MTTEATVVFVIVVGLRFLIPLFIPRWPLPASSPAWCSTASTRRIFQTFGFDPPGLPELRQGDGPVLPVHRLPLLAAELDASAAVGISRFLFFYRMVGVMLFEVPGFAPCC